MRTEALIATVDVRELNTLGWGPLRDTFPAYAGEIELARVTSSSCFRVAIAAR